MTEEFDVTYAPLKISVMVGSGFGCYPAILLKEAFVLQSGDDRAALESSGRRFHKALHDIAAKGCDELWLNPGTESDEVLEEAARLKLNVIQACSIVGLGILPSEL